MVGKKAIGGLFEPMKKYIVRRGALQSLSGAQQERERERKETACAMQHARIDKSRHSFWTCNQQNRAQCMRAAQCILLLCLSAYRRMSSFGLSKADGGGG